MPSIFIGYPVDQKAYKLFDLSTKKAFTSQDVKFHENIFPSVSLKPNSTLPSLTHNSGPIPLVAHDSFFHSTSHASSSLLSNHTSILYPTTENDDLSSPSPLSEFGPSSPVLTLAPPFILHTYTRCPKPSSLPNNPTTIEPSSQIDPNPPPSSSATPASPSPVSSSASIPFAPPSKTPLFSPETHSPKPAAPLRRSSHHIGPLVKLHDYVYSHVCSYELSYLIPGLTKGTWYPPANYVSYHKYKPTYRSFVAQHSAVTKPRSYSKVIAHPEWQEAMRSKLRLSKLMALGLSLHFWSARHRLVDDGCIKLNTVQMGPSSIAKNDW